MIGTFNSNYNYNSYPNYKTDLYYLTNNLYETIEEIPNNLEPHEKNKIITEFKKLHWNSLDNYYKITNRTNLVSIYFICWKIILTLQKTNLKIENKIQFDNNIIIKIDNSTQNMLWDILYPDDMELS